MNKKFLILFAIIFSLLTGCSYKNFVSIYDNEEINSSISIDCSKEITDENIKELLNNIKIEEANNSSYDRNEWTSSYQSYICEKGHDHNKNNYKYDDNGKFKSIRAYSYFESKWYNWNNDSYTDPYTGETIYDISKTDYDHIIPLAYVNAHGGSNWTSEEKKSFADNPSVGVCTNNSSNRAKSAKGPSEWLPDINKEAYCYSWLVIANDFNISLSQNDYDTIVDILNNSNIENIQTIN